MVESLNLFDPEKKAIARPASRCTIAILSIDRTHSDFWLAIERDTISSITIFLRFKK